MEIENSLDNVIEDEKPEVVYTLVKTTEAKAYSYFTQTSQNPINNLLFVSGCFPNDYKVSIRGVKRDFISLKQILQYTYISRKLERQLQIVTRIYDLIVIFEQTKAGNVHYHMLIRTDMHKHDVRAILAELFEFKKSTDIILNINVKPVIDAKKLREYLFNKQEKDYEKLDMNIFKPLILMPQNGDFE